ncbi:MAG TPA: hypothetical protein VIN07_06875 [Flavipsychrobacter sp.]
MKHLLLIVIALMYTIDGYAQKDTIRTISMEEVAIKVNISLLGGGSLFF